MDIENIILEENRKVTIDENQTRMPILVLRGKVIFPNVIVALDVARPQSIKALDYSLKNGTPIMVVTQMDVTEENPVFKNIYKTGVVSVIRQAVKLNSKHMKATVQGLYRAEIVEYENQSGNGFNFVNIQRKDFTTEDTPETEAVYELAKRSFIEFNNLDKKATKEVVETILNVQNIHDFLNNGISILNADYKDTQRLLDAESSYDRCVVFYEIAQKRCEMAKIEKKISASVKKSIDQNQKEYLLREQIKAIHTELGDGENEKEKLIERIKAKNMPKDTEEKALKEVARLDKLTPSMPDYTLILNYLEQILDLPYTEKTIDTDDLNQAKDILDSDHFGLEKVKERIMEYLSVIKLTGKIKGPILCFVGPPGVGKTSIAKSVARALGRKFIRMSLGGVRDEAEIRGHRRTYVGAAPGRIIYGMQRAGTINPVFLLDEIDKLGKDIQGDPASALLEVLDPEQNNTFRDRYTEINYDISKVMFITTANSLDGIPTPLLDRMEIIDLSGYTREEKVEIALRYLIPKQLIENGISNENLAFENDGICTIIEGYTLEAGVRNLEREISSIARKVATKIACGSYTDKIVITKNNVSEYLGPRKIGVDEYEREDAVGTCTGLAWTSYGGTTLHIEVALMRGKGEIQLTGKLGDVMKESARTALSYIKSNAEKYGIDSSRFENTDIHIHVPEGATPKDGPSAGITLATAILSAFTDKKVYAKVAMTGEITLRGNVLPIGGLKEKSLAAFRRGIRTIIIPKANVKDLDELPLDIRNQIKFIPTQKVDEVFKKAVRGI